MSLVRIIHNQQTLGPLVVWDIEDGMPRKELAYLYKQPVYVDYSDPTNSTLPGHVDLVPTGKVLQSIQNGQLASYLAKNYIQPPIYISSGTIEAPVIATATTGNSSLAIVGNDFISVSPYTTTVTFTGAGATTLTDIQITSAGGTITTTQMEIPNSLISGVTTGSSVTIGANDHISNAVAVAAGPNITSTSGATLSPLTINGTNFTSATGQHSQVIFTSPALTLSDTTISGATGGSFTATSIVIPSSLISGVTTSSTLVVVANGATSNSMAA